MTVSLSHTSCRVVAMRPPGPESTMIVGPVLPSSLGPACVAVGFSHSLDGKTGLALVGHLTVSEATDLANMILSAAGKIAAFQSEGRPKQ